MSPKGRKLPHFTSLLYYTKVFWSQILSVPVLFPKAKKNVLRLRSGLESAKVVEIGRLVFCSQVALSPQSGDFRRPPREKGKKKSAGAERKERPPERATLLNRNYEKPSLRGEEDTEHGNKSGKTLARPPIGGPSECRGGSPTFA